MKVLADHRDENSALIINDYPYGRTVRCQIRYWLETNSRGSRFCSQTKNPKTGLWNSPKRSTYSMFGAMFQKGPEAGEEEGHVAWDGLSMYDIGTRGKKFLETYRDGMTSNQVKELSDLIALHEKHKAIKQEPVIEEHGHGAIIKDAPVEAANTLSKTALLEAAKEGAELGTCDEDE